MLKLNQQTVRNWIDQGSLPALRVGRRVRIKRSDFERVLAQAYTSGGASGLQDDGPSAEDFWGGEPVGVADPGLGLARPERGGVTPERGRATAQPGRASLSEDAPGRVDPER